MTVTCMDFLAQLTASPVLAVTVILTLGVVLVNGWTDAPNAIATCVCTQVLLPRTAILMAAVCNFLGVWGMTALDASVASTIYHMADFGGDSQAALIALCAALFAIVVWATAAWWFGIPTSESHALIAGISGAAVALHGGFSGISGAEWGKVLYGLLLSTILGFVLGYGIARLMQALCCGMERKRADKMLGRAQIAGGAAMAFMHGAQDGQKFMGVFLLGVFLAGGKTPAESFQIPLWLMLLCSLTMGLGTSIGGRRIIKAVGMDMVKLERYQGFSADLAGAVSLFLSSLFGLPVSTTHTKTTAIMGAGAAHQISSVKWAVVQDMVWTWVLTFPGCGAIGYLMARLFMVLFSLS